ncbi:MAG: transporter substrate-binding domain-containing protein, partial [Chloroflexota bacterium]
KFYLYLLLPFLVAVQCQAIPSEDPLPQPSPQPTLLLIPPIEPGDGSDIMDRLLDEGVIRVGIRVWTDVEFAPPAFRGASNATTGGILQGAEVDIARALAQQLSLELVLVEAYPPALLSGDWQGEWDVALASLVPFDQSPSPLVFSTPYAYMPLGILTPLTTNIETANDLSGKRVGVLEHSAYAQLLQSQTLPITINGKPLLTVIPPDVEPVLLSNLSKEIRAIEQVANGETQASVDALLGPAPIFEEAVYSDVPARLIVLEEGTQPLAVAVSSQDNLKHERLLQEINKALERLHQQGTLAEIYLKWYGQDLSQNE